MECNIGDEGAKALARCLKDNTTLTQLYLYNNFIGDEGAKAFASVLGDRTSAFLHLRNNFGDWSASLLADALNHNTTLTYLELTYNNIGDEVANALQDTTTLLIHATSLVFRFP